ncbi:aldo/keto reductase [Pseudodesulfovibrio mercurii]|uniref:aldo/keto reductase n=1 Tax=Pseudodesulfovibrio mercurii TaxID=641491 RepID=UPI001930B084|nr:aldo/keto reductase [Pseudodesulfovibrio mercurii]
MTCHSYHGEAFVRKALAGRHPRDSFLLATKLPPCMSEAEEDHEKIFSEQLEKCGVDIFDHYTPHDIGFSRDEV